ncbi:pentapeptide repeat-containing protein [Elioraea rosea]|uniref:pentapeptide repeat-containing protein n=1 Tax=Elioraea rosea TaxID=2492390 RepID=UPI001186A56F|nr:pentapeptide repeat-containing protein [Elioraea rosea]
MSPDTLRPDATPPRAGLKELLDAANDAAKREAAQWFYFVTLMVYLAVAVGGVTHHKLFLAEPVTLPIFNVALPLSGFFVVAPTIFVILHFYSLAQLRVMARKVEAALAAAMQAGEPPDAVMLRLDSFAVAQMLAGRRAGRRSIAMAAMAWITLIIAPVVLLLFFQIRFLPYHDPAVTWVHRVLLAVDLALLWWLWPRRRKSTRAALARAAAVAGTIVVGFFALVLATVPGEWADGLAYKALLNVQAYTVTRPRDPLLVFWDRLTGRSAPPPDPRFQDKDQQDQEFMQAEPLPAAFRRALFDGRIHPFLGRPTSLFSRVLFLPDERFVPARDSDFADLQRTLVLRGRDLRGALLYRVDLRKADLTGALLVDAWLDDAQLQGARLDSAQLQGAWLRRAHLHAASLRAAQLQGASLDYARLEGATLDGAYLRGATLDGARLTGASLYEAELQGASLQLARLQAARLNGARLEGATLDHAQLQAARLIGARLDGASLDNANLNGASLNDAMLRGASLRSAALWRSTAERADLAHADLRGANFDPPRDAVALVAAALDGVPDGPLRQEAADRLAILTQEMAEDTERSLRATWPDPMPGNPPPIEAWTNSLIAIACAQDTAPHLARGLIRNFAANDRIDRARLGRALRDPDACPGARGLTNDELERLP